MRLILSLAVLSAFMGCATAPRATSADEAPEIVAQWNHRAEADSWNTAMVQALMSDGRPMLDADLSDVTQFCPDYQQASTAERAGFFVAFFSGLARYESTWNPRAAGAGGLYHGLLQIDRRTADWHGCTLGENGLYNGADNLRCAVRIATAAVIRDGVIASGPRGIAADWPPMRDPAKREAVARYTRALPQCRAG